MHDHRIPNGGSDDASQDPVSAHAAEFAAAVERWICGAAPPPEPDIEEVAREAVARAWWFVANALEFALAVPGLPEDDAAELARAYERATRLSGHPADEELLARRTTSARRERMQWFEEHAAAAWEEGGIHTWTELPEHIRWVLVGERILTIKQVRELAASGRLLSVPGIGPARQREIYAAVATLRGGGSESPS